MEENLQVVVFNVGASSYAVDIAYVEEILKYQPVTSLPGSTSKVVGVSNIRGSVIPMVDGGILEKSVLLGDEDTSVIVLMVGDKRFGLMVESVREILTIGEESLESLQLSTASGYVKRVIKLEDEIVQLIEMEDFFLYLSGVDGEDLVRDVEEELEVV